MRHKDTLKLEQESEIISRDAARADFLGDIQKILTNPKSYQNAVVAEIDAEAGYTANTSIVAGIAGFTF